MKSTRFFSMAGAGLALLAAGWWAGRSQAADDESLNVRKSCSAFVSAWNKHDAKGMAAVFEENGDSVDPMGNHAVGRADLEKAFAADHTGQGPLRESTVEVKDEPVRFVTADVAVSDAEVVLTGAMGPDGKKGPAMTLTVTNVWKKTGDTWKVFASRPHMKCPPPPPPAPTGAK